MIVKFIFTFEVDRVESVRMLGARLTEIKVRLEVFYISVYEYGIIRKRGKKLVDSPGRKYPNNYKHNLNSQPGGCKTSL